MPIATGCLRCGAGGAEYRAQVPHRSIFQSKDQPCLHGPFCGDCVDRKELQTLPQCECRGLISSWDPSRPRPEPRRKAAALRDSSAGFAREVAAASSGGGRGGSSSFAWPSSPAAARKMAFGGSSSSTGVAAGSSGQPQSQKHESDQVLSRAMAAVDALLARAGVDPGHSPTAGQAAPEEPSPPASSAQQSLVESLKLRGGVQKKTQPERGRSLPLCSLWS
mmetsp:Transcript_44552/g.141957  ORF Transcript_44552/g.141957 Transcript_44552/m.141957 type:complete len:221 (-) Transcript_44552:51-713(-)